MNKSPTVIIFVVLFAFVISLFAVKYYLSTRTNPVACTMEAKLCPDGSTVGRTGPKCEFTACPNAIVYANPEYGFKISLPATWSGYTVVQGVREIRDVSTGKVVETAPTISIRHPLWTKAVPRQDIPVDVYTLSQWAGIKAEKYSVSAAPIAPSELGRNSQYVFALPARYNYAFPEGYKEVENILQNKSVNVFEPGFIYKNSSADLIQVELPYPDAVVGREFSVLGRARGTWFFEASFPVVLLDKDGQVLAQGAAQAGADWMTTAFVPFKIDLKMMNKNYTGKATLILKKDNPSGDAERDASVSFEINIEY